MAERIQKQCTRTETTTEEVIDEMPAALEAVITDEMDALLDEIDEVLEENAQQFVAEYIQKGGQ